MMNSLTIIFAGTPEFGLPCLVALKRSPHHIKAVYTQPDRPAGRGHKVQASAVKTWALAEQIPVYQPINFKTSKDVEALQALKPDVMVVIAYGLILPQNVLDIPRFGCINVHASLLPRWRGASPIQHAILKGDRQSGVTIMQMDAGMDTGDMLCKVECPIEIGDTAKILHDTLANASVEPLLATLDALAQHKVQSEKQKNELATYAGKISKEDALIQWNDSALNIVRKICAYNPWPIAYTLLQHDVLRLHEAEVVPLTRPQVPGTVMQLDKKGMLISTGEQGLLVTKIQFPGAKAMSVKEWLNSGKTQLYTGLKFP